VKTWNITNGKVALAPRQHSIKAYRGYGRKPPCILNFGTKFKW
jgi:hypothetical protein